MKQSIMTALIIVVSLCSCVPTGSNPPANMEMVTDSIQATPTQTLLLPTPSSTSTPVLPIMQGTPYPLPGEILDPDNASRITLLARWDNPADTNQHKENCFVLSRWDTPGNRERRCTDHSRFGQWNAFECLWRRQVSCAFPRLVSNSLSLHPGRPIEPSYY